ncbi:hypothetical protein ACFYQA_08435 [Streptomyces sp. NPDC005774]|uniref:hypothetical protein n=1 Tax=Streptomyces sp. NPDC005774 TaxID=3364728 RepID=UPI003680D2D7
MIAEAIDTALILGWAFAAWLLVFAFVGAITLLTLAATGAWATRALWRATVGPSWAHGHIRARTHTRARLRRHNKRTADHNYQEAA